MFPVRNVGMVFSDQYQKIMSTHPKYLNRLEIVTNLIKAFDIYKYLTILPVNLNSDKYISFLKQLSSFHSFDYLMAIYKLSNLHQLEEQSDEDLMDIEEFGLMYDCGGFPGLLDFCLGSVAGTMIAAKSIVSGKTQICINWAGGWHHAKKYEAAGFCYMNDIVYGIMILLQRFHRVLYLDIDLHHGDGVEEAFAYTPRVFTLSLHYMAAGFFPPLSERGFCTGHGKGLHSDVQFSFKQEGITDALYCRVFDSILSSVLPIYKPDAVVIQCGADGLCTDPHKTFSLTHASYEHVISAMLRLRVPLLVLGGGGYHFPDTAKVWARITALLLGHSLPEDIPEHDDFPLYGPYFESGVLSPNRNIVPNEEAIDSELARVRAQMAAFAVFNGRTAEPHPLASHS